MPYAGATQALQLFCEPLKNACQKRNLNIMIKTNRLTIRKEKIEDASGIQEMLIDPKVRAFEDGIIKKSIKEIEHIINKNINVFSIRHCQEINITTLARSHLEFLRSILAT